MTLQSTPNDLGQVLCAADLLGAMKNRQDCIYDLVQGGAKQQLRYWYSMGEGGEAPMVCL